MLTSVGVPCGLLVGDRQQHLPGHLVLLGGGREVLLERGVAAFKLPDRLVQMDALPLTAIGKIDKRALAATITRP